MAKAAAGGIRAGRAITLVLGLLGALALLAALAAWAARRTLAERALVAAAAARGVAPVALTVERLGLDGIALENLAIGAPETPDLAAVRVEAEWSWAGLRAGRLDALRAEGVRLRGRLDEQGLSLGALDPLLAAGDGAPAAAGEPPLVLPVAQLALEDAQVELVTPEGVARGALSSALDVTPDGAVAGGATLALEHPLGEAEGRLDLKGRPEALAFRAVLEGRAAGGSRHVAATAEGEADALGGALRADWTLAPLVFAPEGGLQPAALYPPLARLGLRDVAARVEARGTLVRERDGSLAWRAEVALRDGAATTALARVEGVHGAIVLEGPPAHTPGPQLVAIGLADVGVPLREGLIEATLRPDGALGVQRARFAFAGGALESGAAVLDPDAGLDAVTLRARDLDLGELLALAALDGLSGAGRLDGELPIAREEGALRVRGGVLRAREPGGTIRYAPTGSVGAMAAARPYDLGLAVEAFSDFRYEQLEARVDGTLDAALTIALDVRGANPGFQNGRPVELHLNLEARLADLVRAGRASYRVPEAVEERLRAFSEGRTSP